MKCPDCERLRQQNKEAAERRDREEAALHSRIAQQRNDIARARARMEHAAVDWTTDPPSQRPGGWWRYTSINNVSEVLAMIEEIDRLYATLAMIAAHEVNDDVEDIKYCQAAAYHLFKDAAKEAVK